MTTEAKTESNRRNALRSTGPKSAAGKALARYNAVRHGVMTAAPVVPGEDAAAWEAHRAGVVASLRAEGALELALAGRVAQTLWRLDRLARAGALGADADLADALLPGSAHEVTFGQREADALAGRVAKARGSANTAKYRLRMTRERLACLESLPTLADGDPVPEGPAEGLLMVACDLLIGREPPVRVPDVNAPKFLALVGVGDDGDWTAGKLRHALAVVAKPSGESVEELVQELAADLRLSVPGLKREARRQAVRHAGLAERYRSEATHRAARALLPKEKRCELVQRYEGHLQKVLVTTLHELERAQAWRDGRDVPLATAVDVTVAVGADD